MDNWHLVSSHEAIRSIFEFLMINSLSHKVQLLSVHLPDEQTVVFTEENMKTVPPISQAGAGGSKAYHTESILCTL